jgi:hypothetical protein
VPVHEDIRHRRYGSSAPRHKALLLGREADGIERPSIVVPVAGKREQALRFDPFSVGSHYHIRPSLRGRQISLWVEEGQKPLDVALKFLKNRCGSAGSSHRRKKTLWPCGSMTPTWPVLPAGSGSSTPLPGICAAPDGKDQAREGAANR